MIPKCANPACASTFDYRYGRVFRFLKRTTDGDGPVQHFWLCEECSRSYSLEYDEQRGVAIISPGPDTPSTRNVTSAA
jgi:hypothetical protein